MGNINGCYENSEQIKNEIRDIVQNMNEIENKINKANKKLLLNIKKLLDPHCYAIEEKTIVIFHTSSKSSFFDKDELEFCQQQMFEKYRNQLKKYLEELKCQVLKGLLYTENCTAYQNNIDFLVLKQYIKQFFQNEFQYEIVDINQENNQQQEYLNTLQNFGDLRESIIIN
ncbi:hypothetical protein TTHERM_01353150 (macronuclear) [Tetrahymena thermophila SB210]|uniref:Uncharacterized protein n=1 Tax=Tetrahymena thermophila (strain SB210) TaxID=312017 RepID=Q23KN2_TETTS|nr:hypothetical protein TTHERM_01353150 [Tetrahymena thermophila SB210]EAR97087.1 hypothetical protein TTHERM_01353150 [Tetrahymena thermophila SB210]|eukprot:XP_001017332.1 hypothetical protein TTHERM_01353150 [Tetrahymena thermophila SB210]